jgi:Trp operon repressor
MQNKVSNFKQILCQITDQKQMNAFLTDLLTPVEIKEFQKRWGIAICLFEGDLSYRQIADKFNTSVTTVTRVSRFLKDEPYQGYKSILETSKHHA